MKPFTAPMRETAAIAPWHAGLGATPAQPARRRSWLLPSDPSSVREARRLTRAQLADWALDDQIDDTVLLVSELVTNALRHAWGPIRLTFCLPSPHGGLRCEIEDANPAGPLRRHVEEHDEEGRGPAHAEPAVPPLGQPPDTRREGGVVRAACLRRPRIEGCA
ncbi:ATP-binding protein [Streptomyces sp. V1I1]|uniref:ATP-binding protein n=1 Tax=Streptomyces sp. V1I1 TaxID=3042272 RepID=UPI00278B5045|nr:ATP-binding protein [Streptomyces sp. V1I1]MDQ0945666.1 anti-sigma regulatory factor (Ser/Thr protein kinase) [Streptomyces sp. V1I1]